MLIALVLAYLFFGGSGGRAADFGQFYTEQAKRLIKAEVGDSERKKGALESAESAKKAIEGMAKQMEKNGKQMKKLYEDYSSTTEQWNTAIQEGIDKEQKPFYDFVQARQALLKSVTSQQWGAIIADGKREDEAKTAKVAEKAAQRVAKERG